MDNVPNYQNSLYTLGCAIAKFLGVDRKCLYNDLVQISKNKLVLILIDGLGWKMMENAGVLLNNAIKINSVFPSTTSTALTTLFTAMTPGEHGLLGYVTYSKRLGSIVNTLRYTHPAEHGRDTLKDGLPLTKVFTEVKSYFLEVKDKKLVSILPKGIENTEFTNMVHKTHETKVYVNLWDCMYQFIQLLASGNFDLLYLYIPDVDTLAHIYGPSSEPVIEAIRDIFNIVYTKSNKYKDKYTFIITADHGHIESSKLNLFNDDTELLSLLEIPPYGDSRAIFFRTRYDIKTYIQRKYDNLYILSKIEYINNGLLGKINEKIIDSLPDFIATPIDNQIYIYIYKEKEEVVKLKGHHSGLTKDEIEIPLVVIDG
ncbi:MAG: alkaline phosphatase family protein [Sulfolobaceae archaeon]